MPTNTFGTGVVVISLDRGWGSPLVGGKRRRGTGNGGGGSGEVVCLVAHAYDLMNFVTGGFLFFFFLTFCRFAPNCD